MYFRVGGGVQGKERRQVFRCLKVTLHKWQQKDSDVHLFVDIGLVFPMKGMMVLEELDMESRKEKDDQNQRLEHDLERVRDLPRVKQLPVAQILIRKAMTSAELCLHNHSSYSSLVISLFE